MADPIKPVRRIVTIDDERGASHAVEDGPSPDVRTDPARPGYASTRIWVTEASPPRIPKQFREALLLPHMMTPPPHGSVYRIVTIPPDASWRGKVGASQVAAFFQSMGTPRASTFSRRAPHPYMQKTQTLDFCLILEGEVTLVLDTEEVALKAGDTVVQRGTNHAWSNRSDKPCRMAISSHDAA
ncbi:MAG TPA: cupin domain-containing protein [Xanthobacteraceae bacterium]|nr:cupin domain-containing protein [Xanthobacteraceae bacterium]